jgi:hypothetical protein
MDHHHHHHKMKPVFPSVILQKQTMHAKVKAMDKSGATG